MGEADAIRLAQEGAKLMLTDINLEAVQAVADNIGSQAIAMQHNVVDEAQWQAVVAKTVAQYGRLDILVNNAGILKFSTILDSSLELWKQVLAVNLDGPFLGCKHAIPAMAQSGGGSIINMSSVASRQGMGFASAYCASKGGVESLTRDVAMFCKRQQNKIRCNSIHPDGVNTPMVSEVSFGTRTPSAEQRAVLSETMAEPSEIAAMVLYLASDEARFVNGSSFLIDNASTITPPVGI